MKVILLDILEKVGKKGQLITVKNGYARNYLIPMKKALLATSHNIKMFEQSKRIEEKQRSEKINHALSRINQIKSIGALVFFMKSSETKRIFGSINANDISDHFFEIGISVKKSEIKMPKGLLRYLGVHQVIFNPHKNISVEFQVAVLSK
ncbi:50S ribosomal protein L9 [Buchnera aphidicola]|uniref:50S ribosomal protein L9 n=1 Tax=Buchnera aphidicola TaxID=9 RepID=UPI00094C3C18|nr:50S ribosomal protein L9 [Buchnera aphidicola]